MKLVVFDYGYNEYVLDTGLVIALSSATLEHSCSIFVGVHGESKEDLERKIKRLGGSTRNTSSRFFHLLLNTYSFPSDGSDRYELQFLSGNPEDVAAPEKRKRQLELYKRVREKIFSHFSEE